MAIEYTRVGWEDAPSTNTPINASNLNHMDNGILALSTEFDESFEPMVDEIHRLSDEFPSIQDILGSFAFYEETTTASKAYRKGQYLFTAGLLYKVKSPIAIGDTILPGDSGNVEQTNVGKEIEDRRLVFENVPVSVATNGSIVDLQDSRITRDYVLEGRTIIWNESNKITALSNWSTDTEGHFIVTGTCTAVSTCNFTLVKADSITDFNPSS